MFLKKEWPERRSVLFSCKTVSLHLWLVQLEDQMKGFGRVWKGMKGYGRVWKGSTVNPFEPFHTLPNPSKPFQTPSFHPEPTLPPPNHTPSTTQHGVGPSKHKQREQRGAEGFGGVRHQTLLHPFAPFVCVSQSKNPPPAPFQAQPTPCGHTLTNQHPQIFGWFGYRWPQENVIHNHTKHRFFVCILISKYNVQQV